MNRHYTRRKNALMRGPTARLTLRELNDLIRRRAKPIHKPKPKGSEP